MNTSEPCRKTKQALLPPTYTPDPSGGYDLYPAFPAGPGAIKRGYDALAQQLSGQRQVTLDGYGGVFWEQLRAGLDDAFLRRGVRVAWAPVERALRPPAQIEDMLAPFLGGDDPLFGTRFTGALRDFFDLALLDSLEPDPAADISIVYGCGAVLAGWDGALVYADLPKNELQFRARSGGVRNLGNPDAADPKRTYKRCYFVDWVALNQHKRALLPQLGWIVDAQRPDAPALMAGDAFRATLTRMSRNYFRVRPWFEPGPWGGQWIKRHIAQLPQDEPNYAWSFELIVPENGLLLESDGALLEASFDWLMYHDHQAVLGDSADRFGTDFPIRFDFLDTVGGGNLSVQCHPRPDYIRDHFGEPFTQDETYYILDCEPGAQVYLGFRDDIDPAAFRAALERSQREGVPVEIEHFVNVLPAHKHDLFLIPSGTVHCSGTNNLVLEISATPYIFTFKLYDWLRRDLEGNMRPLNIARAFDNLCFERRGARVEEELVSRPTLLEEGPGWQIIHLPTHPDHFYDVRRLAFDHGIEIATAGSCNVLSLVEGEAVTLETAGGLRQRFAYAETFVVPAAAGSYRLVNAGGGRAQVIQAFVKPQNEWAGRWYDALRAGD